MPYTPIARLSGLPMRESVFRRFTPKYHQAMDDQTHKLPIRYSEDVSTGAIGLTEVTSRAAILTPAVPPPILGVSLSTVEVPYLLVSSTERYVRIAVDFNPNSTVDELIASTTLKDLVYDGNLLIDTEYSAADIALALNRIYPKLMCTAPGGRVSIATKSRSSTSTLALLWDVTDSNSFFPVLGYPNLS